MSLSLNTHLRRYFIGGLLVWLPIWITLVVINFLVNLLDSSLALIPKAYLPEALVGFHIPGLGVVLSALILLTTGMLVTNFLGRRLVLLSEAVLARIPLVRTIYTSSKQVIDTIFSTQGDSFRKVLLVEYPRKGMWSIAFQTAGAIPSIQTHIGEEMVTIFIPTTPNPTAGFMMMVPCKDVIELNMSVEQAFKLIVSLGVVQPSHTIVSLENNSGSR